MLFVQDVDMTPNPQALKFVLNERVLRHEKRSFANKIEALNDPFATGIFEIEGVVSVFYMDKFVTIEKVPNVAWGPIQKGLVAFLRSFDKALIPAESEKAGVNAEDTELFRQISEVIEQRVLPALANDGGGLEILGLDGYTLSIRYQGACGSCPSSIRGTLSAIENLLRREVNPAISVIPG